MGFSAGISLGLFGVGLIAACVFLFYRRARQRRNARELAITTPNGIEEGRFVSAGGIDQWISIRGEDRVNPVLLMLHGGPGTSYLSFTPWFRHWEKHFTLVQWDRRGVGKTFGRNRKASGEMTLERVAADGTEIAEFLCRHLGQEKILLLGHSMGSMIGITMAARRPDLFHAYVGTEQIVEMGTNERTSYDIILARTRAMGATKTVKELERIGPPPYANPRHWGIKQNAAEKADAAYGRLVQKWGGLMLYSPAYRLRDFLDLLAGAHFCIQKLYPQWMTFDARKLGLSFQTPVFVIEGDSDVMTPPALKEAYIAQISAPQKAFVPIKEGGHMVFVTAAEAYLSELLTRVRPLALAPNASR